MNQNDLSRPAISIGRIIDRQCRHPGTYLIAITIPDLTPQPWTVQIAEIGRQWHIDNNRTNRYHESDTTQ